MGSSAHRTIDFEVGSSVGQHIQLNVKKDGICLATIGFNIQGGYKGGLTGDMWYECGGYLSDVTNIRMGGKTIRCGYLSQGAGTPDQVRFHVDSFSVEVLKKFKKQGKNICKHPHFDAWNKKAASAMAVSSSFNSSEIRIFECSPDYYLLGEDRALTACNNNLIIGTSIIDKCHNSYCDMSNKTYYDLSDKDNTHLKTMLYNGRSFDKQLIAETIID